MKSLENSFRKAVCMYEFGGCGGLKVKSQKAISKVLEDHFKSDLDQIKIIFRDNVVLDQIKIIFWGKKI